MEYVGPIRITIGQLESTLEDAIIDHTVKAVQQLNIEIDAAKLKEVLINDRLSYNQGYSDAMQHIKEELVKYNEFLKARIMNNFN